MIKAVCQTWLKAETENSSQLRPDQKKQISQGKTLQIRLIGVTDKHALVELTNGEQWYIYIPHWSGLELFPNGVLKPAITKRPSTTETIEAIVRYAIAVGVTDFRRIAYILATAEGEANFKPIREIRGTTLTSDQKKYWHTGYYGRGLIQVTWLNNYRKVGNNLGLDLVAQPDLLLTHSVAIASLVLGMRDGWYTGKKLADYQDYWNMRNIVNPGEIKYKRYHKRAKKFVTFAEKWEQYLRNFCHIFDGIVID